MASSPSASLLALLFLLLHAGAPLPCRGEGAGAAAFGLDFHHRFSDKVRSWAESMSWDVAHWPEEGTLEYYTALVAHDRDMLRGRGLLGEPDLAFADGNITFRLDRLGFLHYAEVAIGTPNVTFIVALDTGSDVFWVPCDCNDCAPTFNRIYNVSFNIFRSSSSSTSKKVPCSSNLCQRQDRCLPTSDTCPYQVRYLDNTSTSGYLLEDVLHLITDDNRQEPTQARITFGCGQVQTGNAGTPNGLLGLGLDKISVPSTLANSGLTSNSFSMCFGHDRIGRIRFGDKGGSDQETTPFNIDRLRPTYNVSVSGMLVENSSLSAEFTAFFDSGTSFTILADPAYTDLSRAFDSFTQRQRIISSSQLPFEYCYGIGPTETEIHIPSVSLIMKGEKEFPVQSPVVIAIADNTQFYCLAVMKSSQPKLNIIGQNFMSGLKIVFDREQLVLGWKKFNCYDVEGSSTSPVEAPTIRAPSPSSATGPSGFPSPTSGASDGSATLLSWSFRLYSVLCHLILLPLLKF